MFKVFFLYKKCLSLLLGSTCKRVKEKHISTINKYARNGLNCFCTAVYQQTYLTIRLEVIVFNSRFTGFVIISLFLTFIFFILGVKILREFVWDYIIIPLM